MYSMDSVFFTTRSIHSLIGSDSIWFERNRTFVNESNFLESHRLCANVIDSFKHQIASMPGNFLVCRGNTFICCLDVNWDVKKDIGRSDGLFVDLHFCTV
jgi:hypothetical protein